MRDVRSIAVNERLPLWWVVAVESVDLGPSGAEDIIDPSRMNGIFVVSVGVADGVGGGAGSTGNGVGLPSVVTLPIPFNLLLRLLLAQALFVLGCLCM